MRSNLTARALVALFVFACAATAAQAAPSPKRDPSKEGASVPAAGPSEGAQPTGKSVAPNPGTGGGAEAQSPLPAQQQPKQKRPR